MFHRHNHSQEADKASATPSEAPPSYDAVQGSSAATSGSATTAPAGTGAPPEQHSGANTTSSSSTPRPQDRDIEQENRPLPPGWVPQYSNEHDRFFFVDTNDHDGRGPRSIWVHPLDDDEWLATVPDGIDPIEYIDQLWKEQPEPTPEPQQRKLPVSEMIQQQHQQGLGAGGAAAAGPGYRQGGTHTMQAPYPGTQSMQQGQMAGMQGQPRMVTMEDLVQYELGKMGTPEEYERKHPPSKASKLFHRKESASKRQRRHAEYRARDLADQLAYRAPRYNPYASPYGYPGYGRPYGSYYPGMGMSGAFLGLGAGALLGAALW